MPKVTLVIPVHNRADLLPHTIESVLSQTFTNWECIVVDDSSDDGALDVARQYARVDSRIRPVSLQPPKRYSNAARNYGLELARGEFVTFLDSDDLITTNKLALQVEMLEANLSLDMVTCRAARFREHPRLDATQTKTSPPQSWLDAIWAPQFHPGGLWQNGCALWRTESVKRIGAWNANIRMLQDTELRLRALLRGLRIVMIHEILIFLRTGSRQLTWPRVENCPLIRDTLVIAWRQLEAAKAVTELRRKLISLRFYRLARRYMNDGLLLKGMSCWLAGSRAIRQGLSRTLFGMMVLITGHYELLGFLHRWLRPRFVRDVHRLPTPLPELERIPFECVLSEPVGPRCWSTANESRQESLLNDAA